MGSCREYEGEVLLVHRRHEEGLRDFLGVDRVAQPVWKKYREVSRNAAIGLLSFTQRIRPILDFARPAERSEAYRVVRSRELLQPRQHG